MPNRSNSSLFRAAAVLAVVVVLAGCTPGGQFDPTTLFDNDMFDSKTKLKGQRVPLFPDGVPGATTGVPADLVKGYKPPSDQADADPDAINAPPSDQPIPQETKPKPRPKVAVGRPRAPIEKPPSSTPTRIDIGAKGTPPQQPPQANSPSSPPPSASSQQGFSWPAPPSSAPPRQAAQQSQSIWPAPPPTAPVQPASASAPTSQPPSQSAPSFDSMWPKSTPNGTPSQ